MDVEFFLYLMYIRGASKTRSLTGRTTVIKQFINSHINSTLKEDCLDSPDCYGEYDKDNRLCNRYCALSINCIGEAILNPKVDILDQLLGFDAYQIKPN